MFEKGFRDSRFAQFRAQHQSDTELLLANTILHDFLVVLLSFSNNILFYILPLFVSASAVLAFLRRYQQWRLSIYINFCHNFFYEFIEDKSFGGGLFVCLHMSTAMEHPLFHPI